MKKIFKITIFILFSTIISTIFFNKINRFFIKKDTSNIDCSIEKNITFNFSDEDISKHMMSLDINFNQNFDKQNLNLKNKKDQTKPIIKLAGLKHVYITFGSEYIEEGYEAIDNIDGDLTSKVKINNEIDYTQVGDYKITYTVLDKSNNKQVIYRYIHILPKTKKGVIYLTFDDGPSGVTGSILDTLKEENVKATFFITGEGSDALIKREYEEGHSIGLHTYSHNYSSIYSSIDNYFQDIDMVNDRLKRITGVKSKLIRFAGGSSNTISRKYNKGIMSELTKEVINRGYLYYDWNVDSKDARGVSNCNIVYNSVVNNLSKDRVNIVLMHDSKKCTSKVLKKIIKYGKENGYTFSKITSDTKMLKQQVNN